MTQREKVKQGGFAGMRIVFGCLSLSLLFPIAALAVTPISEGYQSSEKITLGSLVSLQMNSADQIVSANASNVDSLFGVAISPNSSPLSLSDGSSNQVQVATSGTVDVLVSDINGPIERGDHITASGISGVGMKATANTRTIGIAQGELKGSTQKYKDASGAEKTVQIGQIPVLINVAYFFKEPDKTIIPGAIQNVANSLAGREVDSTPILIAGAIFLVTIIAVISLIYSMVRSSIISIGRNPMSQAAVYRNVLQLSGLVLVIIGAGFGSMYMVLTRL